MSAERRRAKKGRTVEQSGRATATFTATGTCRVWPAVPLDVAPGPPAGPDDVPAATLAALDARADRGRLPADPDDTFAEEGAPAAGTGLRRRLWHNWGGMRLEEGMGGTSPGTLEGGHVAQVVESVDGVTWARPYRFVYYPPAPVGDEEAAALGERLRAGVEAAARDALDAFNAGERRGDLAEVLYRAVRDYATAAVELAPSAAEHERDGGWGEWDGFASLYVRDVLAADLANAQAEAEELREKLAEAERETKKPARPQGPTAVGTYPELAVIDFAAADARTLAHWRKGDGGGLEHTRKKAGMQVRFAPAQGGDRWAEPSPAALSDDLFDFLAANGGLDTVCLNQVLQDLALNHEHERVTLDDLGRMIGLDPRTTADRLAMRRALWGKLKFLDGLTVWGERKDTYRDPVTRKSTRVVSADALYLIGGVTWPEQGTLDGSAVPVAVGFVAGPLLAQFRGSPAVLESFGDARRLMAIPRGKVSGAWAFSIGRALTQRWRELASYGKAQKLTRRYLLSQFPPSPTVDEVLASHDPRRARRYFTQALAELKTAGVIDAYSEPDPKSLPRYEWAAVWLAQVVDVTPPAHVLEAGAGIEATRTEAAEKAAKKAAQARRRNAKKARREPE